MNIFFDDRLSAMDAVKAVKDYVTKMINAEGMKVMLLDEETVSAC